jgi:hypothetical protein
MGNDEMKFTVTANDGYSPLAEDEPTFTFRAQDKLMGTILRIYAELCEAAGSPPAHVRAIEEHREFVLDWQAVNDSRIPD